MKISFKTSAIAFILSVPPVAMSASDVIPLNEGWKFHRGFQASEHEIENISLPHTWNRMDAMFGNKDYYRGLANYIHTLPAGLRDGNNRVFLKIGSAQTVADLFVDSKFVTQHRGGYTAFVTELTEFLKPDSESKLEIRVSNAPTLDIAPVCGDFNIYGGLPRGVELIVTGPVSIAHDFYASDGVFFTQRDVNDEKAQLDVRTILSVAQDASLNGHELEVSILDGSDEICSGTIRLTDGMTDISVPLTVDNPILWNGTDSPHLYLGKVRLLRNGIEIDSRQTQIGFRFFSVDPDKGFFLNGTSYRLNGVNRHEDTAARASALTSADHKEDVALIRELGAKAVRLSHYPQSHEFLDLLDAEGLIAWVEIPFVNVYVNNPAFDENLKQQLTEMIYQNYNHPSVISWGLFNEINSGWLDRPSAMVVTLDSIAHSLDPTRLTMGASNQNDDFNGLTDIIAFNKYFGWYGGDPTEMGRWLDAEKEAHPERKIGISEYGAGGSVLQQSDSLAHPEPWGHWHPENWQTYYHIENYRQLAERPWLWCNLIWCMFDFGVASRNEGDTPGRNDKGLVTYDRKTKKDAFYFYKANWNDSEPFVYIAGRRSPVKGDMMNVMAFTNDHGDAELFVNGHSVGSRTPDEVNVLTWHDVKILNDGENIIEVRTTHASDSIKVLPCKSL